MVRSCPSPLGAHSCSRTGTCKPSFIDLCASPPGRYSFLLFVVRFRFGCLSRSRPLIKRGTARHDDVRAYTTVAAEIPRPRLRPPPPSRPRANARLRWRYAPREVSLASSEMHSRPTCFHARPCERATDRTVRGRPVGSQPSSRMPFAYRCWEGYSYRDKNVIV
jgi:hypothetical protein